MKNEKTIVFATIIIIIAAFSLMLYRILDDNKAIAILKTELEENRNESSFDLISQIAMQDISREELISDSLPTSCQIIVFPDNFCDVCNQSFLRQLAQNEKKNNVIFIVPQRIKKLMKSLLKEYKIDGYKMSFRDIVSLEDLTNGSVDNTIYIYSIDKQGQPYHPIQVNSRFNLKTYIDIHQN